VTDPDVMTLGSNIGVAWTDFDGDGDLDLHFLKAPGTVSPGSRLVRNDGNDNFAFLAGSALSTPTDDVAPTWGDYDNDGDLDCYTTGNLANHLFRNDGGAGFRDISTSALARPTGGACNWTDYDQDGDLDLYVGGNGLISSALFRNNAGAFVNVAVPPLADPRSVVSAAWGDYDNDRDQDVYISSNTAPKQLLRNDGGVFVDATSPPLDDRGLGHGTAWADYDNDGLLDLYLVNLGGTNRLLHNEGGGTFVDVSVPPLNDPGLHGACAWGDYDNDGWQDLYFDEAFAANTLAHNDLVYGEFHFTDATNGPLLHFPLGGGVAWGDYDGDGDLDMVIATLQADQPNWLIRNDCPLSRNWLQVDLRGVISNRSGVGARLRAVEDKLVQHREVTTSSGLYSQNSMTVQLGFGLASRSVLDTLEVSWPSGMVQTIAGVAMNQRILVVEDSTTTGLVVSGFRGFGRPGLVELEWWSSGDHGLEGMRVLRAATIAGPWRRLTERPLVGRMEPARFVDRDVEPEGAYFYSLEAADAAGTVLVDPILVRTPFWVVVAAALEPGRPNPFVRSTELGFRLGAAGAARLTVHDVTGRHLATVVDGTFPVGRQTFAWDGRDERGRLLPAGVYFCRLDAAGRSETRKIVRLDR
jgi:hypothetical protein